VLAGDEGEKTMNGIDGMALVVGGGSGGIFIDVILQDYASL
jgi:hypothetical protein